MDGSSIMIWSVLFGGIGLGYFLYGKKQKKAVPFLAGIGLMVYPYFMPSVMVLVIVGAILIAIPYFIRQ